MKTYTPIRQFYAWLGFVGIISAILTGILLNVGYYQGLAYFWDIADSVIQIAILGVLIRIANK